MNPTSGEGVPQRGFESPQQPEQQPASGELQSDQALERANPSESTAGRQQPPPMPLQPLALPADQILVAASDDSAKPAAHHISDDKAKDGAVIEKVWIDKAKSIIAQTRNDPFIQKREMSRVKADYIQKRFNKTIPLDDTAAK